jgi:hypothetical protein
MEKSFIRLAVYSRWLEGRTQEGKGAAALWFGIKTC